MLQKFKDGLSPRGRGNRVIAVARPADDRSIPAWAGEPRTKIFTFEPQEVYPRVGGGTINGLRDGWDSGATLSDRMSRAEERLVELAMT